MSMSDSQTHAPAVEHKDEAVPEWAKELQREVKEVRAENDHLRARVDELEETAEKNETKLEMSIRAHHELAQSFESFRMKVEKLYAKQIETLREYVYGKEKLILDEFDEFLQGGGILEQLINMDGRGVVADLEDQVDEEMQQRGKNDAKLLRRINALAEKAEVEITDSDLMGEDKIRRVIKHGVDDVESSPTKAQERAEVLLRNIGEWATRAQDAYGDRFAISGPEAKQRLKDKRGKELASSQIKRVFKQIEEWGEDSPREVTADFSGSPNRLLISLEVNDDV